jgi:hypothetical protein
MTHLREQRIQSRPLSRGPTGILTFLFIEYFDELVFTIIGVAMPFLRDDLGLDYAEIGLLFGAPAILSTLLEPAVLLLGDTPLRGRLIVGGGLLLGLALLVIGGADTFLVLFLALTVSYPASGAFVGLSQATMIERHPARESEMMARWTAAGTLGSLSGPVLFAAMVVTGLTWRSTFVLMGAAGLGLALLVRSPRPANAAPFDVRTIAADLRGNLRATLRLPRLWRWLLLLPLADLMLDVFFGYIAVSHRRRRPAADDGRARRDDLALGLSRRSAPARPTRRTERSPTHPMDVRRHAGRLFAVAAAADRRDRPPGPPFCARPVGLALVPAAPGRGLRRRARTRRHGHRAVIGDGDRRWDPGRRGRPGGGIVRADGRAGAAPRRTPGSVVVHPAGV